MAHRPTSRSTPLQASPANEFSRPLDPEKVLRIKRDYIMDIQATAEECKALADRFELPDLAALQARLSLRREMAGSGGIEAEGTIIGTVTRICVRTNEPFVMEDLEVPLYAIIRPVTPLSALVAQQRQLEDQLDDNKKTRRSSYRPQDRNIDEMDIMELQRMLQTDISAEDDVLMEDEAIYTTDGVLDLGELVAQLFWLSLDPYPKKPGSGPVTASISG